MGSYDAGMAQRIVSLVPSLTELIVHFGLADQLAGRTRFCTEPPGALRAVPIVGGTKDPKLDRIVALRPSIVVANKEENRREDIEALRVAGLTVLVTDPNTVEEAARMIAEVAATLGVSPLGDRLAAEIRSEAASVNPIQPAVRVFVPIWKSPWLGLGCDTYGHDLLRVAGFTNVLGDRTRYPEVTLEAIATLTPDVVLLPDEPYPFGPKDIPAFAGIAPAIPVDGKLLWWYGPRVPEAIRELRRLAEAIAAER